MANTIEIIGSWPSGETEYVIGTENPSKLPLVSDADNGDVLTVVNGAWKDAAPTGGGGGGGFLVTVDTADGQTYSNPSATIEEIKEAVVSGQVPYLLVRFQTAPDNYITFLTNVFYLTGLEPSESSTPQHMVYELASFRGIGSDKHYFYITMDGTAYTGN